MQYLGNWLIHSFRAMMNALLRMTCSNAQLCSTFECRGTTICSTTRSVVRSRRPHRNTSTRLGWRKTDVDNFQRRAVLHHFNTTAESIRTRSAQTCDLAQSAAEQEHQQVVQRCARQVGSCVMRCRFPVSFSGQRCWLRIAGQSVTMLTLITSSTSLRDRGSSTFCSRNLSHFSWNMRQRQTLVLDEDPRAINARKSDQRAHHAHNTHMLRPRQRKIDQFSSAIAKPESIWRQPILDHNHTAETCSCPRTEQKWLRHERCWASHLEVS